MFPDKVQHQPCVPIGGEPLTLGDLDKRHEVRPRAVLSTDVDPVCERSSLHMLRVAKIAALFEKGWWSNAAVAQTTIAREIGRVLVGDPLLHERQRWLSPSARRSRLKRQALIDELDNPRLQTIRLLARRRTAPVSLVGGILVGGRPLDPAMWGSPSDGSAKKVNIAQS